MRFDYRFDDYGPSSNPACSRPGDCSADDGTLYLHLDYRESHYAKVLLEHCSAATRSSTRSCGRTTSVRSHGRAAHEARHDPGVRGRTRTATGSTPKPSTASRTWPRAWVTAEKRERGKLPTDVWWHTIVSPTGREKTGYPTQKPEGVLRRIVQASSREGDWVLDFFGRQRDDRRGRRSAGPPVRARRRQPGRGRRDAPSAAGRIVRRRGTARRLRELTRGRRAVPSVLGYSARVAAVRVVVVRPGGAARLRTVGSGGLGGHLRSDGRVGGPGGGTPRWWRAVRRPVRRCVRAVGSSRSAAAHGSSPRPPPCRQRRSPDWGTRRTVSVGRRMPCLPSVHPDGSDGGPGLRTDVRRGRDDRHRTGVRRDERSAARGRVLRVDRQSVGVRLVRRRLLGVRPIGVRLLLQRRHLAERRNRKNQVSTNASRMTARPTQ